jgi:hypothetical protein
MREQLTMSVITANDDSVTIQAPMLAALVRTHGSNRRVLEHMTELMTRTGIAVGEIHATLAAPDTEGTTPASIATTLDERLTRFKAEMIRTMPDENRSGLRAAIEDSHATDPLVREVRDLSREMSSNIVHLRGVADARATAAMSSSIKGQDAETTLAHVLGKKLQEENGWTVTRINKVSHSCDIEVRLKNAPLVRIESKSKDTVTCGDVDKFKRDLCETDAHGLLVSLRCAVTSRRRGAVFERLPNGKYAAFLCALRADSEADEDIDIDAVVKRDPRAAPSGRARSAQHRRCARGGRDIPATPGPRAAR